MNFFPEIILTTDAHQYGILAQNLLSGNGFSLAGTSEIIFPPGYSLLLIPFLLFLSPNNAVLTLMYLGFVSLILGMFLLTKKYTNKKIALITALFLALNGNLIFYTLLGYAEILMFANLSFSLYFLDTNNRKKLLLSGILIGIAYLIKPEAILYMGLFFVIHFFAKPLTLHKKILYFIVPLAICILGYSFYLYYETGKIALSGKVATLEWDRYIEDKTIDRHSILYRINSDGTLAPSLRNYSLSEIDFYQRGRINILSFKQSLFELLLPFKYIVIAVLITFIAWKNYQKLFLSVLIINLPVITTLLFHIENRYLVSALFTTIFVLSVAVANLFSVHGYQKNRVLIGASLISFACLVLLTYYSYLPIRADLPGLTRQQQEAQTFLANNHIENDLIISRKPLYSFLAKKDYFPLPYTKDPEVLASFLNKYPNATIILDRWDYFTLPDVHKIIREDYESGQRKVVKDKQVLIFENWEE